MIITDGVHLAATASAEELHKFAAGVGLKSIKNIHCNPHYDITTERKLKTILELLQEKY